MQYVVLLRGINVNGINIGMADLRTALTDAGYADVRTVLASGNVVLNSEKSVETVKLSIEKILSETFRYEAWVIVTTVAALRLVIDSCPFGTPRDGFHSYVVFTSTSSAAAELMASDGTLDPALERIERGVDVVYWEVQKGATVSSAFGKLCSKALFKSTTTTRNMNTLVKLVS